MSLSRCVFCINPLSISILVVIIPFYFLFDTASFSYRNKKYLASSASQARTRRTLLSFINDLKELVSIGSYHDLSDQIRQYTDSKSTIDVHIITVNHFPIARKRHILNSCYMSIV